jgi:hypothetical protein
MGNHLNLVKFDQVNPNKILQGDYNLQLIKNNVQRPCVVLQKHQLIYQNHVHNKSVSSSPKIVIQYMHALEYMPKSGAPHK